ncbi:MAG: tRNA (guanosine(46)-N7)-methyltransferase TrmB [Phycisphaerales bacterium]|nr:MAG: tRNA (guanosine(46)-N7)-methyltransferase TrmB [Phycisphaerales bacterium]
MSFGLARGKELNTEGFGLQQSDLPPFDPRDRRACRVDPRTWFDDPDRRFEIEIGSGKGTFLVQQAALKPQANYLGIESASEFYRYSADRMRRRELNNVRILHADATQFIRFWCAEAVASVIHVYFSDPWPKKRHHKRRVVQEQTLLDFHRVLTAGGEIRLVTDHDDLWAWYEEHAARHGDLFERRPFAAPESAAEGELVGTNYERKFAVEGRPFHAMTLRNKAAKPPI